MFYKNNTNVYRYLHLIVHYLEKVWDMTKTRLVPQTDGRENAARADCLERKKKERQATSYWRRGRTLYARRRTIKESHGNIIVLEP